MTDLTCVVHLSQLVRKAGSEKKFDPKGDTEFPIASTLNFADNRSFLVLNTHDYTCPEFVGGKRKGELFVNSNSIYLDFDHLTAEPEWKVWESKVTNLKWKLRSAFPNLAFAMYPSISQTGCHVLIPLDTLVTTPAQFARIGTTLVQLIPEADQAVKDAGRFSFATCMKEKEFLEHLKVIEGSPLKVEEVEEKARELEKQKPVYVSKEARTLMSPSRRDVMEGLSFQEGSRNNDCLRLADRLLNRYDEAMAKEMYDALTTPCTLDDSEKETVWKHAVNGMLGQGLVYKRPVTIDNIYSDIQMPAENTNHKDITDPEFVQAKYMEYYGKFGAKLATGMLIKEYTDAKEAGVAIPKEFIASLSAMCQQWGEEIIVPQVKESLGNLCPTGKTTGEVQQAIANYISQLEEPICYLVETGQWKKYSKEKSKWVDTTQAEVTRAILLAIEEMRSRITASGRTDRDLSNAIKKLANTPKLADNMKSLLSISYAEVQAHKAYIVATPSGLIDLKAPKLTTIPTKPSDYVFETTRVSLPKVRKEPNKWEQTLKEIIPEEDRRDFFRMAIGSQMTGRLVRDGLFFWVGGGANGKSTLFDTIFYTLGDYAGTLDPEILGTGLRKTEYDYGRARIMGKRVVLAQEAGLTMRINGAQVKRVCSAHDKISASLKYHNSFEFDNTATVNYIANELPSLGNTTDYGLMRRILGVFYFTQRFEGDRANPHLTEELEANWASECLEWLCECAMEYIRRGEKLPALESNIKNIKDYSEEQDSFATFLEECFVKSTDTGITPSSAIYLYNAWCKSASGIFPNLNQVSMGKQMKAHGYQSRVVSHEGKAVRVYPYLDFNTDSVAWKIMEARDFRGDGVPFSALKLPQEEIDNGF